MVAAEAAAAAETKIIVVQNILDGSLNVEPVWFSRRRQKPEEEEDDSKENENNKKKQQPPILWKPLRKCDCKLLNRAELEEQTTLQVEFDRQTANLQDRTLTFNYSNNHEDAPQELCRAIWFAKTPDPKGGTSWQPLSRRIDAEDAVESLYQSIQGRCETLEEASQSVVLSDPSWKVSVVKVNVDSVKLRLEPATSGNPRWTSWLTNSGGGFDLQRGYGDYTISGEDEEVRLGPVSHLCFVVHGIGEAFLQKSGATSETLQETVASTRRTLHKLQIEDWRQECERVEKHNLKAAETDKKTLPPPPNRIELIAIEWYDQLHNTRTSPFMKSLIRSTLPGVPAIRSIANDVVVDVLLYMTPQYCQTTLETVTRKINQHYQTFVKLCGGKYQGKVSLLGHSLGSVICWDLLSIAKAQKDGVASTTISNKPGGRGGGMNALLSFFQSSNDTDQDDEGTVGPSTVVPWTELPSLRFTPHATIFLGSPVGLFLTLRGADAVFEKQSNEAELSSSFQLPTDKLFNVFHPYDPVAYRIESHLLVESAEVPAPAVLTSKDVRWATRWKTFEQDLVKTLGLGGGGDGEQEEQKDRELMSRTQFPLNQRKRVDYELQTGAIDNEYLSALSAHNTYFGNKDVHSFLVSLLGDKE